MKEAEPGEEEETRYINLPSQPQQTYGSERLTFLVSLKGSDDFQEEGGR